MVKRALVVAGYPLSPQQDTGSAQLVRTLETLRGVHFDVAFAVQDLASTATQRATLDALEIHELNRTECASLREHLEQGGAQYDLVWLTAVSTVMECLRDVQAFAPHAKLIFDTTDLQHVRQFRRARLENHAGWLQMALKTQRWEVAGANAADCTLVVSAEEQATLQKLCPKANIRAHPLVYPVQQSTPALGERAGILFVGSFPHHPNQDAMQYYLDEIHPKVQAQLDAPLYIVGPQPPEWLSARATENILVTGLVDDLAAYLNRARVSIAPLRYGAGVKGKVLESMSYGIPVVATSIAAEGIPAREGEHLLIANDAAAFAGAVVKLYRDESLWHILSVNGKHLVREQYSPEAARLRLETLFTELV